MTGTDFLTPMWVLMLTQLFFSFVLLSISANNVATNNVTYIQSPVANPSYFGYSLAVQQDKENLTLWVGSPKYSTISSNLKEDSSAKPGAIFRCSTSLFQTNSSDKFECSIIDLKANRKEEKQRKLQTGLPRFALEPCDFKKNGFCRYTHQKKFRMKWIITNRSGTQNKVQGKGICYDKFKNDTHNRITGPPHYTMADPYLSASIPKRKLTGKRRITDRTVLVSPNIKTKKGLRQCLRFCYHAYSILNAERSLKVFIQYESPETKLTKKKITVWSISEKTQNLSLYWNHTEINIVGRQDGFYKIYFKAKLSGNKTHKYLRCRSVVNIALADITVANSDCGEENTDVNELVEEQSIGLNVQSKVGENNTLTLASCAPLWQQNCGYSRDASGVCYEMDIKNDVVETVRRHNPVFRECVRGKIDIVLLVDQSGSVNHCNFQKIKSWLRDVVRGFNIGETEQDIGIIVYSSKDRTDIVIPLGFEGHWISGTHKKAHIIETVKSLTYEAGRTYTGFALKKANEILASSREEAKKIIILLTDGETTQNNSQELTEQIAVSRKRETTILAVGVGGFNESELLRIAGNKRNIFSVKRFSELEKVRDKLRRSIALSSPKGDTKFPHQTSTSVRSCQTGFSVHFTKDGMIMGSPGCYNLSGNVISYHSSSEYDKVGEGSAFQHFHEESHNSTLQTTVVPLTESMGDHFNMTSSLYSGNIDYNNEEYNDEVDVEDEYAPLHGKYEIPTTKELQDVFSQNISNSYFGYAVTSGFFFGPYANEYVASSAPRLKGYGAVLFYHSLTDSPSQGRHYVMGQQFGEYFGASLCAEDIDTDGFTDLIVGAPLHTSLHADEGRAYVYMGNVKMSQRPDFTLAGSEKAFSRFGSYIASVGDLNKDGYSDIAISAPLEGQGVVYIFHGSKNGLATEYVQKLDPLFFNPQPAVTPSKFGETILGKIDVDSNSYPDLIIGSPGNDRLTILLSRPIINVNAEIRCAAEIDERSAPCRNRSSSRPCFECAVCFNYSGVSIPRGASIDYRLSVDDAQYIPRFGFAMSKSSDIEAQIRLDRPNEFQCNNHHFNLKPKVRDVMNSVTLKLVFHLSTQNYPGISKESATEAPLSDLDGSGFYSSESLTYYLDETKTVSEIGNSDKRKSDLVPILNIHSRTNVQKYIHFKTGCQNPSKCKSDFSLNTRVVDKNGENVHQVVIDRDQVIRLRIRVVNNGPEDGHNAAAAITFSKKLLFSGLKKVNRALENGQVISSNCFELDDKNKKSGSHNFDVLSILLKPAVWEKGDICEFDLIFRLKATVDRYVSDFFSFNASLTSISFDSNNNNDNSSTAALVHYLPKLFLSGFSDPYAIAVDTKSSSFPQDTQNLLDYFSSIDHIFTVYNADRIVWKQVKFDVDWPAYFWHNGSRMDLLRIVNISCFSGSDKVPCSCGPPDTADVNDIFKKYRSVPPDAAKRISDADVTHDIRNCGSITSSCTVKLSCDIWNVSVQSRAKVQIKSIALPSSIVNLKSSVRVAAKASIKVVEADNVVKTQGTLVVVNELVPSQHYDPFVGEKRSWLSYLWWVYLVNAIIGLILLLLLIFCLYKLGFFKSCYKRKIKKKQKQLQDESAAPLRT